jgi:hypothetical protein
VDEPNPILALIVNTNRRLISNLDFEFNVSSDSSRMQLTTAFSKTFYAGEERTAAGMPVERAYFEAIRILST